ncbi:MAG: hypothetical protein DDT30_01931 [Dehalococcoidia bacterium]|nr:hypothetical protein [Bacillota bacterium]
MNRFYNVDTIVIARINIPIVQQKVIRDVSQPPLGFIVVPGDGLFAQVAAGHDQRQAHLPQEQMMQRGIREHDAQIFDARGYLICNFQFANFSWRITPPPNEHNGALGRLQKCLLLRGDDAMPFCFLQGRHHNGEWLARSPFSVSQEIDRLWIGRIAGEKESTQTLDGHDPALFQETGSGDNGVIAYHWIAPVIHEGQMGPASRAGIRLGMKAAVEGVIILPLALGAHPEVAHGRLGTVIRDVCDDGKAGAAVSAVGEGVAIAPIPRRKDLVDAIRAGGNVGRDQLILPGLCEAILNHKFGVALRGMNGGRDPFDAGHGGGFGLQISQEAFYLPSLDLDLHFAGGVAHPSGKVMFTGQPKDEWPKAHPLHHPPHFSTGEARLARAGQLVGVWRHFFPRFTVQGWGYVTVVP